jgi:hypothetical protein
MAKRHKPSKYAKVVRLVYEINSVTGAHHAALQFSDAVIITRNENMVSNTYILISSEKTMTGKAVGIWAVPRMFGHCTDTELLYTLAGTRVLFLERQHATTPYEMEFTMSQYMARIIEQLIRYPVKRLSY